MRATGPVDPSLKLVSASADRGAGREAGLKVGASVSVEVRESLGGGLYRVAAGGRLFVASSAQALAQGSALRAVVQSAGSSLVLRILPRGAAPQAPPPHPLPRGQAVPNLPIPGYPGDQAARSAAAALLREGLAPDARALARVRRAALKDGESGGEAETLAARMEAKGIPSEEGALMELLSLSGGSSGGSGGDYRGGQDCRGGRDDRREEGGGEAEGEATASPPPAPIGSPAPGALDRDFCLEVPEEDFPSVLAELLAGLATRTGEGSDILSLFNHLPGPEGRWILVPFRFEADSVAFSGGLRIQLPYARGGPGRIEADFKASRGSLAEDWSLSASFGGVRPSSLRLEAPRGSAAGAAARSRLGELARSLAASGCSVSMAERGERRVGEERGGFDFDA